MNERPDLDRARIGYVPYSPTFKPPGDRRRFVNWARSRGRPVEIPSGGSGHDIVVLSARADISYWARRPAGSTRIVYDLIDSYLTVPAWRRDDVARGLGKTLLRQHMRLTPSYTKAVEAMCLRADAVVCSTPEQRSVIQQLCPDVRVILDVHDDELHPCPPATPEAGRLRLFWEGLPQNLSGFRPALLEALAVISDCADVSLTVATDERYARWFGRLGVGRTRDLLRDFPVPVRLQPWDVARLPSLAASCDVGVIPLDLDDAFAAGKPENKLLIMWQLGLPVVASATPSYRRVMAEAGVDLTCVSTQDWVKALLRLVDLDARAEAAAAGRGYVGRQHRGTDLRAAWDRLFIDLLNRPPRRG